MSPMRFLSFLLIVGPQPRGDPLVRFNICHGKLMAKDKTAWPSSNPPVKRLPGARRWVESTKQFGWTAIRAYARECEQIRIPMRRNWFILLFIGFWICGWTVGGVAAMYQVSQDFDWFLIFWLGGWALGWIFAAATICSQIAGSEKSKKQRPKPNGMAIPRSTDEPVSSPRWRRKVRLWIADGVRRELGGGGRRTDDRGLA